MYKNLITIFLKSLFEKIILNKTAMSIIFSFALSYSYIWLNNNKNKIIGSKFNRKQIFKTEIQSNNNGIYFNKTINPMNILTRNKAIAIHFKEMKKMTHSKPIYGLINKFINNIIRLK